MIEFRLMRYVLAAADTGSFSRAADQFGIKQSTLSKQINYLEDSLGLALFRRSTQGVVPTEPGERFVAKARRILEDVEALGRESRALARGDSGRFRFGFHGSLGKGCLSAVFHEFRASFPHIEIEALEAERSSLQTALENDQLDLAISVGLKPNHEFCSLSLWTEPLFAGLRPDHPLVDHGPLYWSDLRRMRILVTAAEPGPDIADIVLNRLAGPNHRPAVIRQHVSQENLLAFVGDDSVALVTLAEDAEVRSNVTLCRLHDAFGAARLDCAAHWRRDNRSPALTNFLAFIRQYFGRASNELN